MIEFDKGQTGFLADRRSSHEADLLDRDESRSGTVFAGITERAGNRDRAVRLEGRCDRHRASEGPYLRLRGSQGLRQGRFADRARGPKDHRLLGKPAPEFTLTVLDGPGKTKTITKAELAGKVVVIDFWATWCGPCMQELPEIQKLIEVVCGFQERRGDRCAEPGQRARGIVASSKARREDAVREEIQLCRWPRWA